MPILPRKFKSWSNFALITSQHTALLGYYIYFCTIFELNVCLFQGLGWWNACCLANMSVFAEFPMGYKSQQLSPLRGYTWRDPVQPFNPVKDLKQDWSILVPLISRWVLNWIYTQMGKEHFYRKKAATVWQNGRLYASCDFFSFLLTKSWGTTNLISDHATPTDEFS